MKHGHPNPRLLIPVLVLTGLGVGGWYVEAGRARTRGTLSGFFESQPTQVSSRIGGRAVRILVREGDTVRAGQVLVQLEANTTEAETAARQAMADQAREQLRGIRNGPRAEEIRRQRAVVAELSAILERLRNGSRPEEIGAARARLRQAEAAERRVRAGARPEEVARARAAERVARARLAQARPCS